MLKKRNQIIAKVKSEYWIQTHKFGIQIPRDVKQANLFDEDNGNTLWWDAICQEMKNVRIAFKVWEKTVDKIPSGYQEVKCHIIFDVKMGENFLRKSLMVVGEHKTVTPAALTYASVVSRYSVIITLTNAALNDLEVMVCDIQNAYLTGKCCEKICTPAGPEFGSESGKIVIVFRALYRLKLSGAAFISLLAETLYDLGYTLSKVDPDVWMRPAIKANGFKCYELVL